MQDPEHIGNVTIIGGKELCALASLRDRQGAAASTIVLDVDVSEVRFRLARCHCSGTFLHDIVQPPRIPEFQQATRTHVSSRRLFDARHSRVGGVL